MRWRAAQSTSVSESGASHVMRETASRVPGPLLSDFQTCRPRQGPRRPMMHRNLVTATARSEEKGCPSAVYRHAPCRAFLGPRPAATDGPMYVAPIDTHLRL